MDYSVVKFDIEEKIIRPVGHPWVMHIAFGKTADGGIIACHLNDPEKSGFTADPQGELGLWQKTISSTTKEGTGYNKSFQCRNYYIFFAIQKYVDEELRLVIGPTDLITQIKSMCQNQQNQNISDNKNGYEFAVNFKKNEEGTWAYNSWLLGARPLNAFELQLKQSQEKLNQHCRYSDNNDLQWMVETCTPYDPSWMPGEDPTEYILDFLNG